MKGKFRFGNPFVVLDIENNKVEVMIDTGFNGEIMLPETIIGKLNLKQIGISDYTTASGDAQFTKVYIAKVKLFEKEKEVAVLSTSADFSLAGMELFHDCKVVIERNKNIVEIVKSD